jgi:phosphate transport system substrate-binding protein
MKRVSLLIGLILFGMGYAGELIGAGATFPQPLYSKMFDAYSKAFKTKVNYQGIGSGGGIKQITAKVIDFGGTDVRMNDKEKAALSAEVVQFATCKGNVVLAYNLTDNPQIALSPALISAIFIGDITKWNDPKITAANPGVDLPDQDIFVSYRSDSSGTSYLFTEYLHSVDPKNWTADKVFKTKSKMAVGGKGNAGVAGLVKALPGAIGYVEYAYAKQNGMMMAKAPTIDGYTWLIVYKEQNYGGRSKEKAQELVNLLRWMVTDGQKFTTELDYVKLPAEMQNESLAIIDLITYNGNPLK